MVVRSHSVGDADGGRAETVRLARWRSSSRHSAALARRPHARRPAVACRRCRRLYRRLSERAGRPDATVLERRRATATDVRRHRRLFDGQERRVLSTAGLPTALTVYCQLLNTRLQCREFPTYDTVNIFYLFIIRPRRSPSAAAYSRQTFPWTICRSVCPVHCGETADRIRIPFGIIGRAGPGMRQVVGFGDRSTGRGTFKGEFGVHHFNQWGLYGVRVRHCLNRRSFRVVRAVGRGTAVLDGGPRCARGRGFGGYCSPFSQWQMPLGRRRWNVSDSYAKTWQHFRSVNISLESLIRGLFGDIFSFKITVGVYYKLAKT